MSLAASTNRYIEVRFTKSIFETIGSHDELIVSRYDVQSQCKLSSTRNVLPIVMFCGRADVADVRLVYTVATSCSVCFIVSSLFIARSTLQITMEQTFAPRFTHLILLDARNTFQRVHIRRERAMDNALIVSKRCVN